MKYVLLAAFFLFFLLAQKNEKGAHFPLMVVLVLLALFLSSKYSRDSENYVNIFSTEKNFLSVEPGTRLVAYLVKSILKLNTFFIFLVISFMSVSIKMFLFKKYSCDYGYSLLLYLSYFYFVQDCTQIRLALGGAIFLYALFELSKGAYLKYNILIIIGSLFHYSILFTLILNVFNRKIRRLFLFGAIFISLILYFLKFNIFIAIAGLQQIFPSFVYLRFNNYINTMNAATMNVFNPIFMIFTVMTIGAILFSKSFSRRDSLFLNCSVLSLMFYFLFSSIPVIAFRIQELFFLPMLFLFPKVLKMIKEQDIVRMLLIIVSIVFVSYLLFFQHLFSI